MATFNNKTAPARSWRGSATPAAAPAAAIYAFRRVAGEPGASVLCAEGTAQCDAQCTLAIFVPSRAPWGRVPDRQRAPARETTCVPFVILRLRGNRGRPVTSQHSVRSSLLRQGGRAATMSAATHLDRTVRPHAIGRHESVQTTDCSPLYTERDDAKRMECMGPGWVGECTKNARAARPGRATMTSGWVHVSPCRE